MWQKQFNDYYYCENDEILGTIAYCDENDGRHPNQLCLTVYTTDENIHTIGYIDFAKHNAEQAKQIVSKAVLENQNVKWWQQNGEEWFNHNR